MRPGFAAVLLPTAFATYLPFCAHAVPPTVMPSDAPLASLWQRPADSGDRDLFNGPWGADRAPDARATYTLLDHCDDGRRRDREAARPGARHVDRRDPSDPRRLLRRDAPGVAPERTDPHCQRRRHGVARADFMVLHEGRIQFEGTATELLASRDAYLREFLFMTLPPW